MAKLTPDNSLIPVLTFKTDRYTYHIGVWPLLIEPSTKEIGMVEDKEDGNPPRYVGTVAPVQTSNQPTRIKDMSEDELIEFLRKLVAKWNKYLASVRDDKKTSTNLQILAEAVEGNIDYDEETQQLVFLPDRE